MSTLTLAVAGCGRVHVKASMGEWVALLERAQCIECIARGTREHCERAAALGAERLIAEHKASLLGS